MLRAASYNCRFCLPPASTLAANSPSTAATLALIANELSGITPQDLRQPDVRTVRAEGPHDEFTELADAVAALKRTARQGLHDADERQAQLETTSALLDSVVENIPLTLFVKRASDLRYTLLNKAGESLLGRSREEVIGRDPRVLKSGRHDSAFYREMWRDIELHGNWRGEIWNRRKNGQDYPEWLRISVVKNKEGHTTHHVAHFTDISDRKVTEAQIQRLAFFDSLTGLPNRLLAQDRLRAACASARRHNRRVGLLLIDIDHFKDINDSLGHQHGDALLKLVSERLRLALRSEDTVARVGGDEFLVVLPDLQHDETAATVAADLLQSFDEPLAVSRRQLATVRELLGAPTCKAPFADPNACSSPLILGPQGGQALGQGLAA